MIFLIIVVLTLGGSFWWWKENTKPVSNDKTVKSFIIVKGTSAQEIGSKLEKVELIRSASAFKIYILLTGRSKNVPAGEYDLSSNLTLFQIIDAFSKGPTQIWVTVPEGLRREEIAQKFIKSLGFEGGRAELFYADFLEQSDDMEGYLFPDTYLLPKNSTASLITNMLYSTFERKVDSSITRDQIILASILERETRNTEERSIVAGILIKRLKAKWLLQADATVQYAISSANCLVSSALSCNWWPVLTKDDLEINSPFNTYKNLGLPPSPIANPGLSSIKAVVEYTESPYWFYLHDPSGQIHYAKTLSEHNQNIKNYLH
ncbi:hypothetical protein A2627_05400 [Candidatus Woesebacteria bacterium RIFCSPHIGHO2_01_FULL_39_28]|uniref:Endolytic murein transglycosylase n=1 Tax=Candidatus Woesebacteria bacterium RIFCSPHIGHO2_01_FULL_39_28 TaxID=1802496 RepID=A0A1F7YFJ7_9BACT|nr:MAG: hypothetical protein A2627_05400 [Candidatus Woesebacteria bacterium RIFCSPHIGHO2_01_FULL_39_28]OGM58213.1 MAG: hypothetical protein A3A50_04355 [Candidatus Woesebacteria bacterium RIFCSPLOWO2_01_FULL_38_20]